ncbi:hypothetical protein KAK06_10750 [Ideonella sp. 4Y11]|uniref:Uncharacterized protein n=1 Tax=Ideonella aquatica TaxID=2824119 RepID=A0A941BK08_9BURK|nr:hypothetical protein [Ideonella aquatica]MBQ0959428.1 hypothetical protein [Ideonella aquatica]
MRSTQTRSNPFTMMTNPEAIIQAVERSERLNRLQRRVCRPLDKPLIPKIVIDDQAAFDRSVELDDADLGDADDLS